MAPVPGCRWCWSLNEVRGERFELLAASGPAGARRAAGARVLHLRKLPDALVQKLDAQGLSFWAAQQPGALGLLDRQLKLWLQRTSEELGWGSQGSGLQGSSAALVDQLLAAASQLPTTVASAGTLSASTASSV